MTSQTRSLQVGDTTEARCAHCGGGIYQYADATDWWHHSTRLTRCRPKRDQSARTYAIPKEKL